MRIEKHSNSLIDFNQPLSFVFNNKAYKGFKGDTLASALIATMFYIMQEVSNTDEREALLVLELRSQTP